MSQNENYIYLILIHRPRVHSTQNLFRSVNWLQWLRWIIYKGWLSKSEPSSMAVHLGKIWLWQNMYCLLLTQYDIYIRHVNSEAPFTFANLFFNFFDAGECLTQSLAHLECKYARIVFLSSQIKVCSPLTQVSVKWEHKLLINDSSPPCADAKMCCRQTISTLHQYSGSDSVQLAG